MWGDPRGADEAAILSAILGFVDGPDVRWKLSVEQIKRMLKATPPELYIHPSCGNLIRQMTKLHVKELGRGSRSDLQELQGDGNIQHKVDDHAADALRYFIGPYFVLGMGNHFADLYTSSRYVGSESEDFFHLTKTETLGDTSNDLLRLS
jgi:hypothetical protein